MHPSAPLSRRDGPLSTTVYICGVLWCQTLKFEDTLGNRCISVGVVAVAFPQTSPKVINAPRFFSRLQARVMKCKMGRVLSHVGGLDFFVSHLHLLAPITPSVQLIIRHMPYPSSMDSQSTIQYIGSAHGVGRRYLPSPLLPSYLSYLASASRPVHHLFISASSTSVLRDCVISGGRHIGRSYSVFYNDHAPSALKSSPWDYITRKANINVHLQSPDGER